MSCGTPVVSSKASSLPEVGGEVSVYFDPENLKQFTSTVKEVLQDKSLQTRLSELGLKRASQFSWERTAREVSKVYEEVAK